MKAAIGGIMLILVLTIAVGISGSVSRAIDRRSTTRMIQDRQEIQQAADWHRLKIERAEAVQPARMQSLIVMTYSLAGVFTVSLVVIAICSVWTYRAWIAEVAAIDMTRRNIQARQVALDARTRQYPLLVYEQRGRLYLVNPNTGSVLPVDQERVEQKALASGAHQVQLAGVSEPVLLPKGDYAGGE